MKVLVAEDDDHIRNGMIEILEWEGYETVGARDGREALDRIAAEAPDFICLDIMMPKVNGYDVCREIRQAGSTTPIIFVSAKSEEVDKVLGLELGGDDYIMKPFGVRELTARIRAVTRRYVQTRQTPPAPEAFSMGDLEISPAELRARRGDQTIDLSLRNIKILDFLYRNAGRAMDRHALFSHVWGLDHVPNSRTLDQCISQLRKRIEIDPKHPAIVKTVHGVGYRYDP